MKLTEQRTFVIRRGDVTLFVSIQHCNCKDMGVISYHHDGTIRRKTYTSWRELLDRLSPQLEIGGRIDNPAPGIDYVEAIDNDVYAEARREYWDQKEQKRKRRNKKAKATRDAKKHAAKTPNNPTRRIDLDL